LYADFNEPIYKQRFKIERVFAWQDTYRKLAHSYERLEATGNGLKYLGYALINLRVFVGNSVMSYWLFPRLLSILSKLASENTRDRQRMLTVP